MGVINYFLVLQQFYDDKNDFFYGLSHVFGLKRLTTAKGIVETEKKRSPAAILFLLEQLGYT